MNSQKGGMRIIMKNVVLELTGSMFSENPCFAVEANRVKLLVHRILEMKKLGFRLLISVGFDNFQSLIQHSELGTERYIRDLTASIGAQTNAVLLYTELNKAGAKTKLLSQGDILMKDFSEVYLPNLATEYMTNDFIVVCNASVDKGGYSDEDLAAAARSIEVLAEALYKPVSSKNLEKLSDRKSGTELYINYDEILLGKVQVPFKTYTAAFCKDHLLPVVIFDLISDVSIAELAKKEFKKDQLLIFY
jgi:uridylate kinase